MKDKSELSGIGGWLILVAIGVTISPIVAILTDIKTFQPILEPGLWDALTNTNSPVYVPYWSILISIEIIAVIVIDALLVYLVYLFYKKKERFPKLYVQLVFAILIFSIIDIYASSLMFPNDLIFDPETIKALTQSLIGVVIWVPYMKKSVRVKNTFVNL